jgi:DNA mismatch repair protein MutL
MNRIRLLPEQVANQIAAGEVVERPASVVKELVENALDAKAARITVEIQAGGRSLVRVTDDGVGMSRDDALLCLERHATSKIQRAEDLSAIATLGFRGEALPSIASVSRMTLTTRERDDASPAATQVIINGGTLTQVREAGAPSGTTVEVRQLFFNLPVRRKFLRSEETEYAHIHHYLVLAALAHPNVAFTFLKDGRSIWQLPTVVIDEQPRARFTALRERMRALFGDEEKLLPVDFGSALPDYPEAKDHSAEPESGIQNMREESATLRVWGFIGAPGVSRSTRDDQHLFVNQRPVENRGLNFALIEGYHTALMKGRFPVCCLFLELDPAFVDVNIHPAKREVKFRAERTVRQLTAQAVRETLLQFHGGAPRDVQIQTSTQPEISSAATHIRREPAPAPKPNLRPDVAPKEFSAFSPLTRTAPSNWPKQVRALEQTSRPEIARGGIDAPSVSSPPSKPAALSPTAGAVHSAPPSVAEPTALLQVPLRLIGVVGRLYVVLESDRGLVLMDQHAAHERVLFEQMLQRLESGAVPSQRLLLPETIELSVRDAQFLREHVSTLTRLGVALAEFGERTFLLDGLPPMAKSPEPRRFVLELIDELKAAGQQLNAQRLGEQTIAKTVCRHAVKANDPLNGPELENLVNDLRRCEMPYTCPHGRPTLIEMSYRELEKKFGRLA